MTTVLMGLERFLTIPSIHQLSNNLMTGRERPVIRAFISSMSLKAILLVNWKFKRAKTAMGTETTLDQSKRELFLISLFKKMYQATREAMMTATALLQEIWVRLSHTKMYLNQQVSKPKRKTQSIIRNLLSRNWE